MPSRQDNILKACRADAHELVELERDNQAIFGRRKELKARLIAHAQSRGENFKEIFDKIGAVKVSGAKAAACKGTAPVVVVEAFLDRPKAEQDRLIGRGVVKIAEQWTGAYYGSVTVELF